MNRSLSAMSACLVLWAFASPAHGYAVSLSQGDTGELLKWGLQSVSYSLHPQCSEDISPSATCLDELRSSFAMWAADCSGLEFVEGAPSANRSLTSMSNGSANGINELAFIEDSSWTYRHVRARSHRALFQSGHRGHQRGRHRVQRIAA